MNGKDSEETWQLLKIFKKHTLTDTHTQHARLLGSDTLNITQKNLHIFLLTKA